MAAFDEQREVRGPRVLVEIALVLVVYVFVGRAGLMLGAVSRFATLVWVPSGLSLAALLLLGYRVAPAVFLGAFITNAWTGASVPVALLIATGNTLEAILGAYAMRRAGVRSTLEGLRHVLALIVPAAMVSTLVSATVGVGSLTLGHVVSHDRFWETWRAWWIGDVLGDLVVTPFLLTYAQAAGWVAWNRKPKQVIEAIALACLLGIAGGAMFFVPLGKIAYPLEFPYVLFPLFIWAAVRFALPGATAATVLTAVLAIRGTVLGLGPFSRDALSEGLLGLQTFMGCAALISLVVAGAIADRARLESEAARAAARRETRLRALSQASRDFADASLEEGPLLELIARHVAEAMGDLCLVRLLEEPDYLRLVALHHQDPKITSTLRGLFEKGREKIGDLPSSAVVRSGKPLVLTFHGDFREAVSPRVRPHVEGMQVHAVLAVPLRTRSGIVGSITACRLRAREPYTEEDQGLLQELSDRAGLAISNARLHEDLRSAVRVRDDFLAIAGHELKTPLAAMLMHLQTLDRAAQKESSKLADRLGKANRSAERLDRLVNQLLDVSRVTAGRLHLETEPLNLVEVVKEVVSRYTEAHPSMTGRISLHCDDRIEGQWDRLRVDQVVNNLVANALKYGLGKPIDIDLHANEGVAVLRVTDRGIGIPPEHRERIFQRFERAVETRDFGGLGLGLWISGQIVEASGGKIEVDSTPGEGSTFTVRLPLGVTPRPAEVPDGG